MRHYFYHGQGELQSLSIDTRQDEEFKIPNPEFEYRPTLVLGETKKTLKREDTPDSSHSTSTVIVTFTTPIKSKVIVERYNQFYALEGVMITKTFSLMRQDKRFSDKTWEKKVEEFLNEQRMNIEDYRVSLEHAVSKFNIKQANEDTERFKRDAERIDTSFNSTEELRTLIEQRNGIQEKINEINQKLYTEKLAELKRIVETSEELNATAKEIYIEVINKRMETPYKTRGFPFL